MVSTRRGTSGGPNASILQSNRREDNLEGPPPPPNPINLTPIDPTLLGSSSAPSPNITFNMEQLQRFMMECQKQAFADARAELLAQSAAPPPINEPPPPVTQNRPPPPTPALGRPHIPRREGPTDSTAQSPGARPPGIPPRNTEVSNRPRVQAASIPPPPHEEVAESTCQEERRPRTQGNRDLPRDCPREHVTVRPELEEVSQQILQLSKRVEDLAKGRAGRPRQTDHHDPPRRTTQQEGSSRLRRERGSPFCDEIVAERMSVDSNVPTSLPRYDGSTDPMQHILKFEHLMELHGHNSHIHAKILVTTFQDLALEWFTRLEPASIISYDQLTEKFLHQFASKRRSRLPYTNLYSVKQKEGESTRDFMERFNNEVLKVETPTVKFLVDVLYFGLRNKPLAGALARERPETMERLLSITDSYVEEEEMSRLKYGQLDNKGKGKEREQNPRGNGRRSPIRRFQNFTTLNATRKEIFLAVQQDEILKKPKKVRETPQALSSNKFCLYHKQKGHDTENCYALQEEIERLIQHGYLGKFVAKAKARRERQREPRVDEPRRERSRSPRNNRDNQPNRGVIDTIAGGPSGGDTKSARRKIDRNLRNVKGEILHLSSAEEVISFGQKDLTHVPRDMVDGKTDCPLVITMDVSNFSIKKVLIDNGSSVNIMFQTTLDRMQLGKMELRPVRTPLVGFGGSEVIPRGLVTLPTSLGSEPRRRTLMIEYLIVDAPFAYNMILGRPALNEFRAVVSTFHLKMKFPTENGIGEALCNVRDAWKCYTVSLEIKSEAPAPKRSEKGKDIMIEDLLNDHGRKRTFDEARIEPNETYKTIELEQGKPDRTTRIGGNLDPTSECMLIDFLRKNKDVFAWKASELEGIDPSVIVHRLNVDPSAKPVRQKERTFGGQKNDIISDEVDKLLEAGYIKEIRYTEWLCNVVLVPKPGGKWRMCNDFTDLNKACPKDPYPLPRIDQLVDSTAGCEMLSMMDAFQGYYQIAMAPEDVEKTSFVVKKGVYCFLVMPFGLKNAGATYQRLVNFMFRDKIGKIVEVYVDDMIVKSKKEEDHLTDLAEIFGILRKFRMKLNAAKCTFGVRGGKFLGFMVSQRGIEANPEKIKAIQEITPPRSIKEVQRLVGRVVSLNRFISRLADKGLPFFKALRNTKKFEWTPECDQALVDLKYYLQNPPLLTKPRDGEPLGLYLAISTEALSSVLVSLEKDHRPIYYISRALQGAEKNYPEIELFALALIQAARRLRPYFQSHSVTIFTDQPLRQILSKPTSSGRLIKWAVELSEFDVHFQPRTSIKAQVLADFLLESSRNTSIESSPSIPWTLQVDGSSLGSSGGVGIFARSPDGIESDYAIKLDFQVTNNEAEYEAVIAGVKIVMENRASSVIILTDSQLVASQFDGTFETREESLQRYLAKLRDLTKHFSSFTLQQVPREENNRADALSKLAGAMPASQNNNIVLLRSIRPEVSAQVLCSAVAEEVTDWRSGVLQYLRKGELPDERNQARRIRIRSARYFVTTQGDLFRKSVDGPPLKCLGPDPAAKVVEEVHAGICGNHTSGRVLAQKIRRAGYFWPTLLKDSVDFVKKCQPCQFHSTINHAPPTEMVPISSAWPFEQWGIDLVGPFPPASGQRKFLVVAVEYFTKWVEAEALAKITDTAVWNFIWKNIICRFGLPKILISDNGSQFQNKKMKERCEELGIEQRFTSVGKPQTNGQTEVTNRTIVRHLKSRLGARKGTWADDLPAVLWSYRTTPRSATEDTPYALVYGSDAMMPIERMEESVRCLNFDQEQNQEERMLDLDLLEERRLRALSKAQLYQARVKRTYDARIKVRNFRTGDWVLKKVEVSKHVGKLDPTWDGPYKVVKECRNNSYILADENGNQLPRPWSAGNLRKFFI